MWKWILKLVDFLRALLAQQAETSEKQKKETEELEQKRQEIEAKVEEKYEDEQKKIPTDGTELVDYWKQFGVQPGDKPVDKS